MMQVAGRKAFGNNDSAKTKPLGGAGNEFSFLKGQDPPIEWRNNREFMMERVKENGLFLYFVHPELLFDKELLLTAIRNNGDAFRYVPWKLKRDEEFVKEALELNGDVFVYLSSDWRERQDLLDISLKTSGKGFCVAGENLIENCSIYQAIQVVYKYWPSAKRFKNKMMTHGGYSRLLEIVIEGEATDDELFESDLISDKNLIMKMLDISYRAFLMANQECTLDKDILLKALGKNPIVANYFTIRHFTIIINQHSIVKELIENENVNVKQFSKLIVEKSVLDNVRLFIMRYPELVDLVHNQEMKADPFILRYSTTSTQLNVLARIKSRYKEELEYYEKLGYVFSTTCGSISDKLKNRFAVAYPGLIIPFHRFGIIPEQIPENLFCTCDY